MSRRIRHQFNRLLHFLRPKPQKVPLDVDAMLARTEALGVVERFNDLYYTSGTAGDLKWAGAPMIKNPCDLWMMVELIQKVRPRVLIETGTHHGASAIYYADMARTLGIPMRVVTVDINPKWHVDPAERGIDSVVGYSTDPKVFERVKAIVGEIGPDGPTMVTLDSDHSAQNVLEELRLYGELVTPGSYVVVEDTNVNGHPSFPEHGPGPFEAVEAFLGERDDFEIDRGCERFFLTFNPSGFLRRVGAVGS